MFKKLFISGLAFLGIFLGTTTSAFAASMFDGGAYYGSTSDNIGGARANITYQSKPTVYNTASSCAWTMINDGSSFAQVGWAVEQSVNSGNVHYFFAYENAGGNYVEKDSTTGPSTGSTHLYKTDLTSGVATGYVDSAVIGKTSISWIPTGTQYFGEIGNNVGKSTDAQLPGKTSLPETFSSVYVWKNSNWTQPSLTWGDNVGIAGISTSTYSSNGSFKIWDTRY